MQRLGSLLIMLVLVVTLQAQSQGRVNRLALFHWDLKEEGQPADSRTGVILLQHTREYLETAGFYQILNEEQTVALLKQEKISKSELYDLAHRRQLFQQLAEHVDYVVLGELMFFSDGVKLGLSAQLFAVVDGRMIKSAAASGNKLDLKGMANFLAQKLLPTHDEIVQEIKLRCQKIVQKKEYAQAVLFYNWLLDVEPKKWEHHYQRAKMYEANSDFTRAEEDLERAEQLGGRGSIEADLQRIRPQIVLMRNERKKLLDAAAQKMQDLEMRGVFRRTKTAVALLHELGKANPNQSAINEMLALAVSLQKTGDSLQEELAQIRGEDTSKDANLRLAIFEKNLTVWVAEFDKIVAFFIKSFGDQGPAYFTKAMEFYRDSKLPEAFLAVEKSLLLTPQASKSYYWRGIIMAKERDYPGAIASLTIAIQQDSDYVEAYYNRGLLYEFIKDIPKALADFESAIKIKPDLAQGYFNIAQIYHQQQEFGKALDYYHKAVEYSGKDGNIYFQRARLFDQIQEYVKARSDYQKAVELSPQLKNKADPYLIKIASFLDRDGLIYADKAKMCLDRGELPKALEYYTKALEFNPDHAMTCFNRGMVLLMLGQYDKAEKSFSDAISLRRAEPEYYLQRAIAYQYLQEYPKALQDLQQAINYNAFFHAAYHRKGIILEATKEYDKAIESYHKAIQIAGNVSSYYADLSQAYLKIKQEGLANSNWIKARELQK